MGTVKATAGFTSHLHRNMLYQHVIRIQAFILAIRLCISQKIQHELAGFLGPTSLTRPPSLTLRMPSDSSSVPLERDYLLVINHIVEIRLCSLQLHIFDCVAGLSRVFEVHTSVTYTSFYNLIIISEILPILHVSNHS